MKIVIDVPEEVYNSIQDNDYCGILNSDMYNAIKNGTPLSEKTTINSEKTTITDTDLISKQSVLDLPRIKHEPIKGYGIIEYINVDDIKKLPSAEKTANWVGIDDFPHEVWECDHCGFVIDGSGCIEPTGYRDLYNFCPNCGARMKGDTE